MHESEVEEAPAHLSPAEASALPLTGLTGWRALVCKSGNAEKGRNILITGIGGGVALNVLQFAVGLGANAYVTSGDEGKIEKAKQLGAKGGVNYKSEGWEKDLKKSLPKDRPYIDTIIDGAGGNVMAKAVRLLKVCHAFAPELIFMCIAWWSCRSIWHDRWPQDGLDDERRTQQSRIERIDYGLPKRVQGYGCFR